MATRDVESRVDQVTLELIENSLRSVRYQMDAAVYRAAMSPVIREQHDEFPLITDPDGAMIVGQFGSFVGHFVNTYPRSIDPGDVFLLSDPYTCLGAVSHINDWLVLVPIFFEGARVGFSAVFGHQNDVGGPVPGSLPTEAKSVFGEGIAIPPVKLYTRGTLQEDLLDLILNNVRQPEFNRCDLMALITGCRVAEKRVHELCSRFGKDTYLAAIQLLLDRTRSAFARIVEHFVPEEPTRFEDWVDDDGLGHGPFKLVLTMKREGMRAHFDWTGTDAQAEGPINFYVNERLFKMHTTAYMIALYDPQVLFNDGSESLLEVTIPEGSILKPIRPAGLGQRTHVQCRQIDVLSGALAAHAPEAATAAGFSTSPHMIFSGVDDEGEWFTLVEICCGGIPGRPVGDGLDGHSMFPLLENIPIEYLERYYPIRILRRTSITDSGGAGLHRGGNGVETIYEYLCAGEVSIHDDRWLTYPWGINGGKPGARSAKSLLLHGTGGGRPLPSKVDHIAVSPGDRLVFRTWGGGGWGDPLERPLDVVRTDVRRRLVSAEKARREYGVVFREGGRCEVDAESSRELRAHLRRDRGGILQFDFGPPIEQILARAKAETGLEPPQPQGASRWTSRTTTSGSGSEVRIGTKDGGSSNV